MKNRGPNVCPVCGERVSMFAAGCSICGAELDPQRAERRSVLASLRRRVRRPAVHLQGAPRLRHDR